MDFENNIARKISLEEYLVGLDEELGWDKEEILHLFKLTDKIAKLKEREEVYNDIASSHASFISMDEKDSYVIQMVSVKIFIKKLGKKAVKDKLRIYKNEK